MTGIQFVTDEKGRRTHSDRPQETLCHWGGLLGRPCVRVATQAKEHCYEEYRTQRLKHNGRHG